MFSGILFVINREKFFNVLFETTWSVWKNNIKRGNNIDKPITSNNDKMKFDNINKNVLILLAKLKKK